MSSKYGSMNDHDLIVLVVEATDRQEQHLKQINGTVSNSIDGLVSVTVGYYKVDKADSLSYADWDARR